MNSPTDRCMKKKHLLYLSWTLRRPDHFHGLRLYRLHGAGDRVPRAFGWFSARWHGCVLLNHRCEHSNETRAQRGLGKRNAEFVFGFCETLNSPFKSKTLNNLPKENSKILSFLKRHNLIEDDVDDETRRAFDREQQQQRRKQRVQTTRR